MLNTKFPPWPDFTEEEGDAVKRALLSNKVNYWTGDECRSFEREFAAWVGTEHAIALANGTVALDAILMALGIGQGDDVVVTPRTFIASASCIVTAGARPVFADVDSDTQNITATTISEAITPNTRAIICVHLAGMPCDMDPIMDLASKRGLFVIEDCAQAHGARYKGRSVGSIGHAGAWSFCQDKIMTTGGEGGMVTTNDKELWSRIWSYKDHGKSWEACFEQLHPPGYRWLHESLGTNWRMIELQAILGRIQLTRMADWTVKRRSNCNRIWDTARKLKGLRVPVIPEWASHAGYKCYVFVEPSQLRLGWDRDRVIAEIADAGVPCFHGSCSEVYLEKAFVGAALAPQKPLKVARNLGETSVMFLAHPSLEDEHITTACRVLTEVMSKASK
jgi:dTDP-4-amino-4,6-dideoxygalactose transaminase